MTVKNRAVTIGTYLDSQSRTFLLTASLIVILCVGYADYITGEELTFSIFYLVPIAGVSWYASRNSGIALCVVSSLTEFFANYYSGRTYSHPLISLWNSTVLLGFFLVSVFILSLLKAASVKRKKLINITY